ncbi:hypothetical protein ACLB2K_001940 [Fragaria x ananassa]
MDILIVCESGVPLAKAKRFLKKIGFHDAEVEEARGFSGGIWVLYDKNKVYVSFVDGNSQSVIVKVMVNNQERLLTAFCHAWLIIGDSNELYCSADKNGGSLAVQEAIFSIGGLKAPGVDGFPALFFHKHWNLLASEGFKLVSDAFSSGVIPDGLNHTLITLVPKIASPQDMALFRPISLCSTLYKAISKVVVARLRPYLSELIGTNQASFIPGRQISDNIIVAQEVLHKFQHSKGANGFLAWKIDLSKAYDRLH